MIPEKFELSLKNIDKINTVFMNLILLIPLIQKIFSSLLNS